MIIREGYYPQYWLNILNVSIEKGKGIIIGKLWNIQLIEADLQLLIRIYIGSKSEKMIEKDERLSKANYGLRKNYLVESVILEK